MELGKLSPAEGATKSRKRIGRGQGSGRGGTSTRGHKGDKSRSGAKLKRSFEGGQTPMQRRLPKRGFKNINRVEHVPVNLTLLETLVAKSGLTTFSTQSFIDLGIAKVTETVKILGTGKLSSKVEVNVAAISVSARTAIESLGGTVIIA
jgi:large subunit ribosomal protein L15